MRDEAITRLVLSVDKDLDSAASQSRETVKSLAHLAGWSEEDILHWMADDGVCLGCIDNFEQNNSLYSPNDCSCRG